MKTTKTIRFPLCEIAGKNFYLLQIVRADLPEEPEAIKEGVREHLGDKFLVILSLSATAEQKKLEEILMDKEKTIRVLADYLRGQGLLEGFPEDDPRWKDPKLAAGIFYTMSVEEYVSKKLAPVGPKLAREAISLEGLVPAELEDIPEIVRALLKKGDFSFPSDFSDMAVALGDGHLQREVMEEIAEKNKDLWIERDIETEFANYIAFRLVGTEEGDRRESEKDFPRIKILGDYFWDGWGFLGGRAFFVAKEEE